MLLSFGGSLGVLAQEIPVTALYSRLLNKNEQCLELVIKGDEVRYLGDGLLVAGAGSLVRLDRYYALASRFVRYQVRFSGDTHAVFQGDTGPFKVYIDIANKKMGFVTDPRIEKTVDFLNAKDEYFVEIHREYQQSIVRLVNLNTGERAEISATHDGRGGHGRGAESPGFAVGLQYDYYCFGITSGGPMLVKQMGVYSRLRDLTLLMYGDSITEPDGYYPSADFRQAWTQLVIKQLDGRAAASARGGTTILQILKRIKNELPYIKAKYVMVTIGTNGKNTEENLSELVEYIQSQGAIPLLNNIPANESGTQIPVNAMIEKVRKKYGIKGCRFDLATSVHKDGLEVDKTAMYLEDYAHKQIYHHPNIKGAKLMFEQTLIDIPEIYK
ncbi:SGNH/GDSL hydrolase family protein [Sphingobacterium sp. SGG-5]|nr:SGNH/GDSL hydrolase family protein [Sphingobacterium sp. SGG-5]